MSSLYISDFATRQSIRTLFGSGLEAKNVRGDLTETDRSQKAYLSPSPIPDSHNNSIHFNESLNSLESTSDSNTTLHDNYGEQIINEELESSLPKSNIQVAFKDSLNNTREEYKEMLLAETNNSRGALNKKSAQPSRILGRDKKRKHSQLSDDRNQKMQTSIRSFFRSKSDS